MNVYAVGVYVTKYKYNNAWLDNKLTSAESINLHVILALISTRQAISRFSTEKRILQLLTKMPIGLALLQTVNANIVNLLFEIIDEQVRSFINVGLEDMLAMLTQNHMIDLM